MSLLTYKGYQGTIEVENDTLFGEVLGLENTFISYEGNSLAELRQDFKAGIDNYLESCRLDHEQSEQSNQDAAKLQLRKLLLTSLD